MPSKKRNKVKAPPRKAAVVRPQSVPDDSLSLLANPSDLRALEIFFTQTRGFRLALALHDDMRVRDRVNRYLQKKLQACGIDLLLVDLRTQSLDTSLLGSAAAAFAAHRAKPRLADGRAALVLVNLESRVNYNPELADAQDQKSAYLATANLQRDLWPTTFDGPVLIWMPELLEPALAKWAPDLWHWRSHVFDLRKTQQEKAFVASADGGASRFDFNDETQAGSAQRLAQLQTQLDAYRKACMRRDEARLLLSIGRERLKLGQAQLAKQNFEVGLTIAHEEGDKRGEGIQLGFLGIACSDLGQSLDAIGFYEQALTIAREIGHKDVERVVLGNLASALATLGKSDLAIDFYEQSLGIARKTGNKRVEGNNLGNLGNVWAGLGESHRAIVFYEQALAIAREVGNKSGEAANLGGLSTAWSVLGDRHRAIGFCEQAVSVFREIGDKRGESDNQFNLALTLMEMGTAVEQQQAVTLMMEALAIFETIESPHTNAAKAILAEWQAKK